LKNALIIKYFAGLIFFFKGTLVNQTFFLKCSLCKCSVILACAPVLSNILIKNFWNSRCPAYKKICEKKFTHAADAFIMTVMMLQFQAVDSSKSWTSTLLMNFTLPT
jgi:hypothetical protein